MELVQTIDESILKYHNVFNKKPAICSIGPGRVNLMGEHTDYNDGFVLPMALSMSTVVVGGKSNSQKCRLITLCEHADDPKDIEFIIPNESGDALSPGQPSWANYVKGVIANFKGNVCGFNAVIATSIPVGGGLSSSAALEVATYKFLESLTENLPHACWEEKAAICQKAEHDFAGMPCGIMDQFISLMGKKDCAMLLDCRSLKYTVVPIRDPNVSILITNTNVRHKLTGSEYPTRRKQCEEAAAAIGKSSLRDVTLDELEKHKSKLSEVVYRRARHVVSEIERTMQSAVALQKQDYAAFGALMNSSHQSLKEDYEVSCQELNQVVRAAVRCEGVYGSRMTGGGFGGCTVTLLNKRAVPRVIETIQTEYFGEPIFYVCQPSVGAHVFKLN